MKNENSRFSKEKFQNVADLNKGVIYSWTWNSEITKELIEKQLTEMKKLGIKGIYILPEPKEFRPNHMATYLKPDYLSEEYFELVKYAVQIAKGFDMTVWLYDEGGWPSGGACGQIVKKYPDATAKYIKEECVSLKKGEMFQDENVLAIYSKDFKRLALPYTAEEDTEIYVYAERYHDTIYTYVLDDRVMDEFISSTYEGYKNCLGEDFGNYVSAIFTDEPNVSFPYCINEEEFEKESGYCLRDNLPAVFHNGISKEADKFKTAYIEYSSRQFEEKYMKRLRNWCDNNGILFTGHMSGEDILKNFWHCVGNPLKLLRQLHIPGMDTIWRQIFPNGKSNTFFPRVASSAAHQTGGNLAVSESFAAHGNGLTIDEMRYIANYQFVRGINIINIMSITTGRDRFLSGQLRPHFSEEFPSTGYITEINDYITRMMYVCSIGEYTAETAIYMPVRDEWIGIENTEEKYSQMGKELEEKQIYFDIVDDEFLEDCELSEGKLCMGGAKYKSIYIPQSVNMSEKAVEKLERFIEDGGYVCGNAENIKGIKEYNKDDIFAEGVIKTENKNIRAMKKKSENETVYVIYNESTESVVADIEIPEENYGFHLNMQNGKITKLETNNLSVSFESGEVYTVIYTDEELSTETEDETFFELAYEISEFEVTPKEQLLIKNGAVCVLTDNIEIDERFSGSSVYRCNFADEGDSNLILEFEDLYYYAHVFVNGNEIGKVTMSPQKIYIDKKYLKENNELSITVTNTAANAFYYADLSGVDKKSIGPYNEMAKEFEKDSLKFGLAKVKVYKEIC